MFLRLKTERCRSWFPLCRHWWHVPNKIRQLRSNLLANAIRRELMNTVESHYNAVQYNMILHTLLQWLRQSMNHGWTHKIHPIARSNYEMYIVRIREKIDRVITAPYCIWWVWVEYPICHDSLLLSGTTLFDIVGLAMDSVCVRRSVCLSARPQPDDFQRAEYYGWSGTL